MTTPFDLIGLGVGPFNLSLAALLEKTKQVKNIFFEKKANFEWHSEMMFADSTMQTTYLKDLVTPVDPTSPYSFLNYLLQRNLFYQFLNTQRTVISRREFEQYCTWVSQQLSHKIEFNTEVRLVNFKDGLFHISTDKGSYQSQNICVATGLVPRIPDCAYRFIGPKVFHAKSPQLKNMNLEDKSVVIIGGGQTGIEIFRNALQEKWGKPAAIRLMTRRKNLEPLDESAFTNDYFTPAYVDSFWNLNSEKKEKIVASQKLASDGNTPSYLLDLYNDLYRLKHVELDPRDIRILACRNLLGMNESGSGYKLQVENCFQGVKEEFSADIVILSTGFQSFIPPMLEPLFPKIHFDDQKRFQFKKSYAIKWDGPENNRIYALNFSRHNHGIVDPQTSLMAWRSGVVINDLIGTQVYNTKHSAPNFVEYHSHPANSAYA